MTVKFENNKQPVFLCPHCNKVESHVWVEVHKPYSEEESQIIGALMQGKADRNNLQELTNKSFREKGYIYWIVNCKCNYCQKTTVWITYRDGETQMVYPQKLQYEPAHKDMPNKIKDIYNQAGQCLSISAGASAALSRVCLEKLLEELNYTKGDLNDSIAKVIKDGKVSSDTAYLLDIIRGFGNQGAHTGTINLDDEIGTAEFLLSAINKVVDELISKPKATKTMFEKLPEGMRKAIKERDNKK